MAAQTLQDIVQKLNATLKLDERTPPELCLAKLRDELAAKRAELKAANPQHLSRFALEKRCIELEEALQLLNQEMRRAPQRQLLARMRQAVEDGEKVLYDALIMSAPESLLPTEGEPEFRNLLEVKRMAAEKRWPLNKPVSR